MASWLTPKHLDDLSRVLRGAGLVLAHLQGAATSGAAAQLQAAVANAAAAQLQASASDLHAAQQLGATNPLVGYLYPQTVMLQQQQGSWGSSHHAAAPAAAPQPLMMQHEPPAAHQAHASVAQPQRHQQHEAAVEQASFTAPTPREQLGWQQPQAMAAASSIERQSPAPSAAPAGDHAAGSSCRSPATHQLSTAPATPVAAAEQQQPERIDSWMSGHDSVTTQAEAAEPLQAAGASPSGTQQQQQQQQQPAKLLRERR
jgi:hypothetical protein